jgi:DNA-binding MarR family transcriptional regulator
MNPAKFERLVSSARKAGIATLAQLSCLIYIANHGGGINHYQMAADCRLSRTGACHMTRRLHELEFITRVTGPGQTNEVEISLSPLGRAWLESVGISAAS